MKRLVKFSAILAVAALSLVACKKQEFQAPQSKKTIDVTFSAGMPSTRTMIAAGGNDESGYDIEWSSSDVSANQIALFEIIDGEFSQAVKNTNGSLYSGVANFNALLVDMSGMGDSFKYASFYPASAITDDLESLKNSTISFSLPATQNYVENSFDKSADLLISKLYNNGSNPLTGDAVVSFQFARLNAIVKMNLTNLTLGEGELVESISFKATDKVLAAPAILDVSTGFDDLIIGDSKTNDKITINLATPSASVSNVWFSCFPTTLETGDSYEIVITTNLNTYTKTGTIGANPLKFKSGDITTFSVNFATAVVTPKHIVAEGDYIILAKNTSEDEYYALSNVANGTRLSSVDNFSYSGQESIITDNESIIWHIGYSGENYVIYSVETNKYLSLMSRENKASTETDEFELKIDRVDTYYKIRTDKYYSEDEKSRFLGRNTDIDKYKYFAFYTSDQHNKLIFIPATYQAQAKLEVDTTPLSWEANDISNQTIIVTATNADKTPGEWTASINSDLFTYSIDGNQLTVHPNAINEDTENVKTATLTITFGEIEETITLTQKRAVPVGAPVFTLVTDVNELNTGDKILIVAKDYSFALGALPDSKTYMSHQAVVLSEDKNNVISKGDAIELTISLNEEKNTCTLEVSAGSYLSCTAKNSLKTSNSGTNFNLSINNKDSSIGVATISTVVSEKSYNIQYNANKGQERFACYAGTQQDVYIYKKY